MILYDVIHHNVSQATTLNHCQMIPEIVRQTAPHSPMSECFQTGISTRRQGYLNMYYVFLYIYIYIKSQ